MDGFLVLIQQRVANISITSAATRNLGPPGTVAAARDYLANLGLQHFVMRRDFNATLESATLRLRSSLPNGGQYWGVARKFVNLFLEEAVGNYYLREAYKLDGIEDLLELPLDTHCAEHLLREAPDLPRWRGVIHLLPTENARYQSAAQRIAEQQSCLRVHLDLLYWRSGDAVEDTG